MAETKPDQNGAPNVIIQNPGQSVKPVVPDEEVDRLVKRLYGLVVTTFSPLNSYDDINFYIEVDQNDHWNPHLKHVDSGYVLKIFNRMDSQRPRLIDAQHAFMEHLKKNGISVQEPIKNLQGNHFSIEKIPVNGKGDCYSHWVEIRTYLPGTIIANVPYTPKLLTNAGAFMARMRLATESFEHPFYRGYYNLWSLSYVPKIRDYLFCVDSSENKELIENVLDAYDSEVVPQYSSLPKGCIHGDTNEQNILVQKSDKENPSSEGDDHFVSGILDYTDVHESYLVVDLALTIAYLMMDADDSLRLDVGSHVISGYKNHVSLSRAETDVLPIMVAARLCQSLVLGLHAYHVNPENGSYVLTSQKAWPILRQFWNDKDTLLAEWKRIVNTGE
ncbi:hydroxylysine kinase-like isoform X2 [Gigantopelta aegis]|nr:hydroxylysine kinase-like isoform X2 [Gigantopelta aegis]XP_041368755.1 hydroxylysine kinase-like isoform X2 [Gigantopelta aegis]XP_041368756.1 hydroxylysine kinase-like isoform X2 [Gigantopelta aegis]